MRKISLMILFFLMVTPLFGSVFAGVPEIHNESISVQPRYTVINSISSGLSIDTSGMATCSAKLVSGSSGSDCYITMELQQKSGSKWSTIKAWTASKLNGSSVSIDKDYYVVQGTYRVKVTGTVENAELDVEETAVKNSKTVVH